MSEVKNVLFIVNKYSGAGYQPGVEGRMLTACEKFDIECSIEFTAGRGHATELAKEGVIKNFDRIIAVGGDGTVNEVARSLVNTSTPMGIIPKGSGNGLGRHLGISMKIDQALDQVLSGEVIVMDTFLLNEHLSLNVSGIGFDGHVANLFSEGQKRGFWGYTKLVVKEYLSYKEFDVSLQLNNHPPSAQTSFMLAIANSSQYGNNAKVAPIASITDQALQLVIIKKVPAQRGFHFGYQMFTGKLEAGKDYECLSFQQATINVPFPVAYHIDGEPCGHSTSFKIELLPRSINMIVPVNSLGSI
jgi:YegS/Rv2252/BmrU family lipid kinase